MFIRDFLSKKKAQYLKSLRCKHSNALREALGPSPCIISNNCLGGIIYQDINLPYTSPTAGLYFFFPDYIEFLKDLKTNLKADIEFVDHSKYELGNQRYQKVKEKYPIGLLDGKMEIHFLHYHSQEEAAANWKRRAERFDDKNLIVLGTELDLCSDKDIKDFDQLPFRKKCFLTRNPHNLASVQFVKEFEKNPKIGDPNRYGYLLYQNIIKKFGR